ncbi:hypothetical protein Trydic_g3394 [Trypoxylus dichotomus]
MSIASSIASNIDDGNTLSQSLLNDSNFWKDFLKDDCHLASHSSRITEENEQFLLAKERTDSLQTTVEIIHGIIFQNVICRASIVGLIKQVRLMRLKIFQFHTIVKYLIRL